MLRERVTEKGVHWNTMRDIFTPFSAPFGLVSALGLIISCW